MNRRHTVSMTEEIVVTGEDFVERRILVFPEDDEVNRLCESAFGRGYKNGWARGFVMAVAIMGAGMLCVWLALRW
jgi:hypothetical protein